MTDDEYTPPPSLDPSVCTEPLTAIPGPWPSRLLLNGDELFVDNRGITVTVEGKEHRVGVDTGTIVGVVYSWEQGYRVRVEELSEVKRWRAGR